MPDDVITTSATRRDGDIVLDEQIVFEESDTPVSYVLEAAAPERG